MRSYHLRADVLIPLRQIMPLLSPERQSAVRELVDQMSFEEAMAEIVEEVPELSGGRLTFFADEDLVPADIDPYDEFIVLEPQAVFRTELTEAGKRILAHGVPLRLYAYALGDEA